MAQAITSDDIEILFGRELTDIETDMAEMYISFAEGEIENYLGRPIQPATFQEKIFPDADGVAYFKKTPVLNIHDLTVNGLVVDTDFLTHVSYGVENVWDQILNVRSYEIDQLPYDYIYGATVEVRYSAGLDYPDEIRSLIASSVLNKMRIELSRIAIEAQTGSSGSGGFGVKRISVDDYEVEYFNAMSSGNNAAMSSLAMFPSPAEFITIKRFKRPGLVN
jgi:hypothetical protein